jgi:hypothetical protein
MLTEKIPFAYLGPEVDRLTILSVLSDTLEDRSLFLSHQEEYLKACGWTVKEYEDELINRINANWHSPMN